MSRVGKKPILIPEGAEAKIDGQKVTIKGPKGELTREIRPEIKAELKEGKIILSPQAETKKTKAFWGLTQALLTNMAKGVTEGYEKKLQIEGIGFKANTEGENLILYVGFTNPVKIPGPQGIKYNVEKNIITVLGFDKELVGQISRKIKQIRPPDPYKGKGIRYLGEVIKKKAGKKVVATK